MPSLSSCSAPCSTGSVPELLWWYVSPPPLRQASLKRSQVWVRNASWGRSEFRLRWAQRAVVHSLLEKHCVHMAEDLAATHARARSLNEKT